MYPPPPPELLQRFQGHEVTAVYFYRYMAQIIFEKENALSLKAAFRFSNKTEIASAVLADFPIVESALPRVIGQKVQDIACDSDATLTITFSNEDVLIVYANDPKYEAYDLWIESKRYIF